MKLAICFCCLLGITTGVYGSQGFYFPDEIDSSANANSNAWSDGHGNSGANSNANAVSSGGSRYPDFYRPYENQGYGHVGHHDGFNGGYPDHGYNPDYPNAPYDPYGYPHNPHKPHNYYPSGGPSGFGSSNANAQAGTNGFGGQSNSNAQANTQNFGNGNSISNAIAGSQSLGSDGSANAAAAAASAGTSFVNGVPIASAAAAASAASAFPHGSSTSSSSANAGGSGGRYPGGFNQGPYDNYHYQRNPWLRNGGTEDDKEADVIEAASVKIEVPKADTKDSIHFEE